MHIVHIWQSVVCRCMCASECADIDFNEVHKSRFFLYIRLIYDVKCLLEIHKTVTVVNLLTFFHVFSSTLKSAELYSDLF